MKLGNGETSAILKDFDNRSTLRDCGNSTTHSKCLALIGVSIQNLEAMLRNSTDPAFNFGVSSKDNFSISHEDLTNKLRRKRNSKNDTFNSMNTNQREYKSGNVTEVLADSSYVNPVLERAPLPYTDLKDKTKPGNQKSKDMATAHNHRLGTQEKVKKQKNSEENSTDNIHSQPSKPKYVFAPVTPTLKKYKVIQRKPDSKFQESSPPQVIYSDESDDSLFDYIEDMRTKNTNLYPYKFPDFNFPNLNHASFNFDDSDEDSEGVRGGEDGLNDQEEKKGGKQTPQIIDAHDSHDMEHEYVASEEGVESEKREKTQQPENDNDDEDTGEEEEEGEGEGNDDDYNEENNGNKNKQEAEEDEEYADEGGNGEQKSEEETQSEEEEEEEENKEDEGNEEHERAKNLPNNNYHHIPAQGPESTWRPNGFPINYRPSHNSQLQNNVGGGYDIPVTRYPYSSTDDIKQDFISHPLAGPTASKGFNHDFTPLRGGRPLTKGPFGVEPPHKYPIVPLFDKNTLHKPLSTTVPAGPVSPINLSGFNGYKHFVAPLVSAEDQTPFNEYNNPRQSGSRYRETYRGGSPHGQKVPKAHRGRPNAHVKDEKVVDEEIEEEKEDEFPLEGVKEDDDNLHYPDFDDFHLPTNPYIIDNSSNTQSNINHRIKPSLSTNNSPNNFNFLTFEDKNQHNSNNYQRLKPNIKEEDPNYYQTTYSKHPDHYSKTKSTFNPHPKQSSTSSKNKFPVHDGNGQPSKPFLDKLQGGYIENPAIQESGKYDYPYGSEENGHRPTPEKNSHPSVDGASNPSNYPTKTSYEDYSFPKNINYHNLHYPTIKSNHKNYDGLKEITKYDKFENYPAVNDSSFEFHPQDSNGPHVDFKSQSVPYNFTSGVFGDLTDKQKYYNSMKNTNPFDKLLTPSSDSDNGKDSFPNGYKYPFSTNEHYQNAHDSTKRPSDTHYGHYNVPPYESISNYRNKNSGDLSPTQSLKGYDMFGNLHEKYKNHKPNKPINKKRNKSKLKKKSRGKKNNSNSNLKTHQNRPKTNSKKYIAQDVMNEDTIRDFDTIPNPSTIPLGIFGHNRLESDFAGTGTGNTDSERSNVPLLPKILNTDQTEIRLPKKSIYDLHGLYHRKNYKASDKSDDNHNMRAKFMGNQDKNILGTGRATSRTNPTGFYYDSPDIKSNGELRDKHVPLGYSYDEELDEPSTEAPEVVPRFVGKVSGKNNRAKDVIFEKGESNSLSKKELVDTLNKILDKKDAISREKNINENGDKLGKYSNYWVLEYSMPTE